MCFSFFWSFFFPVFVFWFAFCFSSGGYVGLFVGYTVSQAPILLCNLIAGLTNLVAKLRLMSNKHKVEPEVEEELGEESQRK